MPEDVLVLKKVLFWATLSFSLHAFFGLLSNRWLQSHTQTDPGKIHRNMLALLPLFRTYATTLNRHLSKENFDSLQEKS